MSIENKWGLEFHHFGLAVLSPEKAAAFLYGLNYHLNKPVYDPLQNVNLIWARHPHFPDVEVVSPSNTPGPLDQMLQTRKENIYHLCFQTEDLKQTLEAIKKDSGSHIVCVSSPKPAVLFEEQSVSFYFISGFGLIEILEKTR